MLRDVQPEILDALAEDHPAAKRNRRDMRLLNALMGNFRWIAANLRQAALPAGTRVLELAAGDGELGRHLVRNVPGAAGWQGVGVDLWRRPPAWPGTWRWEQDDVRTSPELPAAEVIVANHILHQFSEADLRALGQRLSVSARLLVINETARRPLHLWQARLSFALGMNYVSRHDALASIRAGFWGTELPALLGLAPSKWEWHTRMTWLGGYRLLARRKEISS